jgi:hypothetical protein
LFNFLKVAGLWQCALLSKDLLAIGVGVEMDSREIQFFAISSVCIKTIGDKKPAVIHCRFF